MMAAAILVMILFSSVGLFVHLLCLGIAVPWWLRRDRWADVTDFTPPVSLLKPVRGLNAGDEENFRSFFKLDYPAYELLFLVHEDAGDDPSLPCIERLIAEHPRVRARIIRTTERVAVHEKVNNYIEGIRAASHDVICVTDADAYVDRDYLRRDVRPLSDPSVGLVTSFQTMNGFRCAATAFEGLPQNYDGLIYFMDMDVIHRVNSIYGHSVLYRKQDFYRVNAMEEIKDHILDDISLGTAFVTKGGMRVEFSRRIVPTRYPLSSWKRVAAHVLRWKRFQRAKSRCLFGLFCYYDLQWGIAAMILSLLLPHGGAWRGLPLGTVGLCVGGATVGVRLACVIGANLVAGDTRGDLRYIWTLFLYDPYAAYASIACYFVTSFEHAGQRYRIIRNRMRKADPGETLAWRGARPAQLLARFLSRL